MESFVRTTVDQVLPGVELVERWQDPATGELWSYAVLLRSRVNVEPMGLKAEVLGRRVVDGEPLDVVVGTGTALKSGDGVKVAFEASHDGYVYVLLYDSKGEATRIFPNPEIALDNRVKGRVQYQIPTGEDWFVLDDSTGEETIYVVASREPMSDIDTLVAEMERAADPAASQKLASHLQGVTRGMAGIGRPGKATFTAGNAKVQRVTQAITGVGRVVRVISFSHR